MPLIRNPAWSEKRAELDDFLYLADFAAAKIEEPNPDPLAGATRGMARAATRLAGYNAGATGAEQALAEGFVADAAQAMAELAATPFMIEAP